MIEYKTERVCSRSIQFRVEEGRVKDVAFTSGCDGNLQGISKLVEGMDVQEVINRLESITCGSKNTSCPAQLAKALKQHC
jgi:uncharacterized protein (TIGR03905 family)